jgi:RNA recognition motif-containing protein
MVNNLKYINDSSLSSSSISLTDTNDSMNSTTSMSEQNERTVYLGDLDLDINESTIEDFFISIDIKTLKIIKQPHSSFAHVTFENTYIAKCLLEKAIISMNGKVIRVMPFNQPNNFDPNANLIIKNLESNLNELHIVQKFKVYGDILSCKLVRGPKGESKCYAYLQFKHKSSANDAIDNLNNTYWFPDCDPDINYKRVSNHFFFLSFLISTNFKIT